MKKFEAALLMLLWLPLTLLAQQRDVTRPPAAAAGAAEIAGVVVSPEGEPVRRAVVTLTGDVPVPRSMMTDDVGAFAFGSLAAGSFSVTARKAAYLTAPYGATRPGRAGTPISLAAAQRASLRITMFKGAAVTGVLRDSAGLPVGGIDVRLVEVRSLAALDDAPALMATTNDLGEYRLYGLLPGEYLVAALPGASGEINAPSPMDLDATLAALASRTRSTGTVSPTTQPVPAPPVRPIGYAPVFYPGTPHVSEAARLRVALVEQRAGIDFEVKPVPVAAIDGVVSGDVSDLAAAQVSLIPAGPRVNTTFSSASLAGKPMDAQGRFRYANLTPGRYRLIARARRGDVNATGTPLTVNPAAAQGAGGRGGSAPAAPQAAGPATTGDYLYGFADVDVRGVDVAGVSLSLQLGGVISGRIVLDGATAKPADILNTRLRMSSDYGGWSVSSGGITMGSALVNQSIPLVKADGTFEIRGIAPGRFTLSADLPADAQGWSLRSAKAGDRDLLDDFIEMVPGMEIRNVTLTFTDRPTELSGTLQSASGQPTTDYYVVLMPEDRALWRAKSRRIVSARPSTTGRFVFSNVPAGSYVVAALSDLDPLDLLDLTFLEQIAPAGVRVTVTEGEKKVQDLRIK